MSAIILRVLDGADRGRVYEKLNTPISIGREEGNTIQLNDERVSRFHLKIQEDHDKVVLTDLESTNGTRVNGEDVQLRILRYGDMISIGRSVLLYGSREQIVERLTLLRSKDAEGSGPLSKRESSLGGKSVGLDYDLELGDPSMQKRLYALQPPELPERMSPAQAAQLAELLDFLHIRMRELIETVTTEPKGDRVSLDMESWQNLLDLQSRVAGYLRAIGEP